MLKFLFQIFVDFATVEVVLFHLLNDLLKFELAFFQSVLHFNRIRVHAVDCWVNFARCNLLFYLTKQFPN
jgi:hypothetical protein